MSGDNKVYVELSGRESKLLDLIREMNDRVEQGTEKIKKQKEQFVDLDREAQRVINGIATAQENHNKTLERLNLLREKDKLTEEQYARAVAKSAAELDKANTITAELVDETRHWSKEVGDNLFGGITKAGIALQGIQMIQQGITSLVQEELQLRAQGGEKRLAIAGELASLAQYENFGELRSKSRELLATGAYGEDASAAIGAIKDLQGSDMMGQFDQLKQVAASMLFGNQFSQFVQSTGQFSRGFAGQAGGVDRIMSAALGASYGAPAEAQQILSYAGRAAGAMSQAGFSPDETLALADIVSRIQGDATPASLQSFARAVSKDPELKGLSVPEVVYKLQGVTDAELYKRLPDDASKVFQAAKAGIDELDASEARIDSYVATGYGAAAMQRAFDANAGIRPSMQAIGQAAATRIFDEGENSLNVSTALREASRLSANQFLSGGFARPLISTPAVELIAKPLVNATGVEINTGEVVGLLSSINSQMAESNSLMKQQRKAAPSAVPATEK